MSNSYSSKLWSFFGGVGNVLTLGLAFQTAVSISTSNTSGTLPSALGSPKSSTTVMVCKRKITAEGSEVLYPVDPPSRNISDVVPYNIELVTFFEAEAYPLFPIDNNYRIEAGAFSNLCRKVGEFCGIIPLNLSPIEKAAEAIRSVGRKEFDFVIASCVGSCTQKDHIRNLIKLSSSYSASLEYFQDVVNGPGENTSYISYSKMRAKDFKCAMYNYCYNGKGSMHCDNGINPYIGDLLYALKDFSLDMRDAAFKILQSMDKKHKKLEKYIKKIENNFLFLVDTLCDDSMEEISLDYIPDLINKFNENAHDLEFFLEQSFLLDKDKGKNSIIQDFNFVDSLEDESEKYSLLLGE